MAHPRALGQYYELVCTFTIGINRSCNGTIFLPKGKLVVAGVLRYRQFYELSVTGGTGLYNNARDDDRHPDRRQPAPQLSVFVRPMRTGETMFPPLALMVGLRAGKLPFGGGVARALEGSCSRAGR